MNSRDGRPAVFGYARTSPRVQTRQRQRQQVRHAAFNPFRVCSVRAGSRWQQPCCVARRPSPGPSSRPCRHRRCRAGRKPSAAAADRDYRVDAARHVYASFPSRIHKGKLPPLMYAVMITDTEIDASGQVVNVSVARPPAAAKEVAPWVVSLIRNAAPFPAPTKLAGSAERDLPRDLARRPDRPIPGRYADRRPARRILRTAVLGRPRRPRRRGRKATVGRAVASASASVRPPPAASRRALPPRPSSRGGNRRVRRARTSGASRRAPSARAFEKRLKRKTKSQTRKHCAPSTRARAPTKRGASSAANMCSKIAPYGGHALDFVERVLEARVGWCRTAPSRSRSAGFSVSNNATRRCTRGSGLSTLEPGRAPDRGEVQRVAAGGASPSARA